VTRNKSSPGTRSHHLPTELVTHGPIRLPTGPAALGTAMLCVGTPGQRAAGDKLCLPVTGLVHGSTVCAKVVQTVACVEQTADTSAYANSSPASSCIHRAAAGSLHRRPRASMSSGVIRSRPR